MKKPTDFFVSRFVEANDTLSVTLLADTGKSVTLTADYDTNTLSVTGDVMDFPVVNVIELAARLYVALSDTMQADDETLHESVDRLFTENAPLTVNW